MKTILVDAVYTFVVENGGVFGIFEDMRDLLESFPNRKIVLTNASDEKFKAYNFDKVPYEIFTLRHNPDKIDPKYFEIMLEHFGLGKDDVIYFEHDPEAVKSAESVGIVSYHYDPDKKDLGALRVFLEKNEA